MSCRYCYAHTDNLVDMSMETARQGLELAFARGTAEIEVGFFGGEPMLQWDLMREVTSLCESMERQRHIYAHKTVTTNGVLIDAAAVEWFRAHRVCLNISIDGTAAMHDELRRLANGQASYDCCIKGLRTALRSQPDIQVIVVADPRNVKHLSAGVRYLAEQEAVWRIAVAPNMQGNWTEDALHELEGAYRSIGDFVIESYRRHKPLRIAWIHDKIMSHLKGGYAPCDRCGFGRNKIAIHPSGEIFPCEQFVGSQPSELCIGSLSSGLDKGRINSFRSRLAQPAAQCRNCAYLARCIYWCGCMRHHRTGSIDQIDGVICFTERLTIAEADRVADILYSERNPTFLADYYLQDKLADITRKTKRHTLFRTAARFIKGKR